MNKYYYMDTGHSPPLFRRLRKVDGGLLFSDAKEQGIQTLREQNRYTFQVLNNYMQIVENNNRKIQTITDMVEPT